MKRPIKPLAKGSYILRCRDKSLFAAAANGHSAIWPEARADSNGTDVRFVRDGKQLFFCSALYAAANFDIAGVVDPH